MASAPSTQPANVERESLPDPAHVAQPVADTPQNDPRQQALEAWLRWNDTYERVTAVMYQAGQDQTRLQELMDQMDQLRAEAVSLSRKLVD